VSITPIAASPGNRLSFLAAPVGALFLVIAADLAYIDWCWAAIQRSLSANQIEAAMRRREFTKRLLPREPGMDLWYSRGLLAASARITSIALRSEIWAQSLDSGQRAVDTSDDRPNALYNLAFLYSVDGNIVEAEATARLAVVAAPNWFKPHWLLAEMLSAFGRFDDAEREAGLAVDLNGGKNPEVSEAIQRIRAKNQVNKQLW
jgi:tetratricopeptide (TPR) repeat protein